MQGVRGCQLPGVAAGLKAVGRRDDGDTQMVVQYAVTKGHVFVPEGKELASQKHLLFATGPLLHVNKPRLKELNTLPEVT